MTTMTTQTRNYEAVRTRILALAKVELARLRNIVRRIRDGRRRKEIIDEIRGLSRMVVPTAAQESRSP
ncbi:MAG: hypothetical protein VW405_00905 [Rhodospirillaceae bacterium]|jgi:hypothetical protein